MTATVPSVEKLPPIRRPRQVRTEQPRAFGEAVERKQRKLGLVMRSAFLGAKLFPMVRHTKYAAGAVLFFCSPLSDYVTAEVLICGGGMHF